jgi:hypothetical protein
LRKAYQQTKRSKKMIPDLVAMSLSQCKARQQTITIYSAFCSLYTNKEGAMAELPQKKNF